MLENIRETKLLQPVTAFDEGCYSKSQHSTKLKQTFKTFILF